MRPVQAVAFWPLRKITNFRSIYGRAPGGTAYSKDYLQTSGEARLALNDALAFKGAPIDIFLKWPTGSQQGTWKSSTVAGEENARSWLKWGTSAATPNPWKLGDPSTNVETTIDGDPSLTTVSTADAEHARIDSLGLEYWLVAIKILDDPDALHIRVYIENPPAGYEGRGVATLPAPLQAAMRALPAARGSGAWVPRGSVGIRAPEIVQQIQEALSRGPNVLLTGPPGTGKTVALEDIASLYSADYVFDPDQWDDAWGVATGGRRAVSLVFHPSYSYENFVASLVPAPASGGAGGVSLKAQPGPLLSMAHWCGSPDREALIIIDEFNRAPTAAVFGDILALLDGEKRTGGASEGVKIIRAFPDEPMHVDGEYAEASGNTAIPKQIGLPLSLGIVAALNSSDRSVAPLDAALRRRFEVVEVPPDVSVLARYLGSIVPDATTPFVAPSPWTVDAAHELALRVLMVLNERITQLLGPDFTLGHALFWGVKGSDFGDTASRLAAAFEGRVLATLRATFVDQEDALAAVLNIGPGLPGSIGEWRDATGPIATVAPRRLILKRLSGLSSVEDRLAAIASVL